MTARAFISGMAGTAIGPDEVSFFRDARPWGLILFKRNIENPAQVTALTAHFREIVGWDAPVLVDQEGGRVQRLGPPHWPVYPPGSAYAALYELDRDRGLEAARLGGRLLAEDLAAVGIDVDCVPVADVPVAGADRVIGDRAFGDTPEQVAALAGAQADGLMSAGVLPVVKHLPGHGRATADSHLKLPVVETDRATLEATDFAAFRPLSRLPLGMTAHVVFSAIDAVQPATTSAIMIGDVIRGSIGFEGLLMSDDVSMGALSGTLSERSRAVFAAGCDLALHCNGKLDEMQAVAEAAPMLAGKAAARAERALALRRGRTEMDIAAARARFASLMNQPAGAIA
ncbi:beta-N-acetylhexosaminidase [Pseudorhodoplanes sp.]|uniref:beta-N-acetylhexosaminidase n=1 Tax=Pseudorhodoplanes sp. TaxID=1934341 RepID=UPI002CE309B6|nr:beta-N-acetylhexosaminidase [Pseudorhodoplanes sp.]HWV54852.1 beta-N-acetylhexosaminidase [Pseudorhodoplanes sp.]